MYIGKDGMSLARGTFASDEETREAVWMLVLSPKCRDPIRNVSGLCCTLKNVRAIAHILGETKECVQRKIVTLGHQAEPAVFKTGDEDDMKSLGEALSPLVCGCHFVLAVMPV